MQLFDLDGTLIDSNGVWTQIDIDFLNRRGFEWSEEYNEGVIHAIFPTAAAFTKEFCHLEESPEEIMAEWRSMALEHYAERIPVKAGVPEYLEKCARTGEEMALFTAAEPSLCQAAFARHGFGRYIHRIVYAQDLGVEKRSPAAFREAARRLGVSTEEITFYDDSPVACRGAKEAGCTVIGVYDNCFADYEGEIRALADGYIRSFTDLL